MALGIVFSCAVVLSFASVAYVSKLACSVGALANPGRRHIHSGLVPKLGGLSVALGLLLAVLFSIPLSREMAAVFVSSGLVLALGAYDDVKGASWREKLAVSVIATSVLIFYGGLEVRDLGNILGFGDIRLGILSVPFTCFALFGIMNAANLVDGLNGLLCGISIITFLSFALLGYLTGNTGAALLSVSCLGAVIGFIPFNYPKAKIFLGDTGSLFIGFLMGAVSLMLIRGGAVKTDIPPLVLLLPIFDALRVMGLRLFKGSHPFRPDRRHFHHLLMRSGISCRSAVHLMWAISAVFAVFAVISRNLSSEFTFVSELSFMFVMGVVVMNLKSVKTVSSKVHGGNGRTRASKILSNETGAIMASTPETRTETVVKARTVRVKKEENTPTLL